MQNYSKRVHCSECGGVFPTSETELLSVGKTVLRLCMKDYEPRRKSAESAVFSAQEKMKEVQKDAAENIKNRKEKK
jgi:hypothetical protein